MKISLPENIDPKHFTNIIFDWGGVITELNFEVTYNMFKELGIDNFKSYFTKTEQIGTLMDFETGKISPEEFRRTIGSRLIKGTPDEKIDNAWNSVLGETPRERVELLKQLKKRYNLYLLSNTNKIHTNYYNRKLQNEFQTDHYSLFIKPYYSYDVGLRKPDPEIFKIAIRDSKLDPERTIFIDDTEMHVDAAVEAGLHAFHLNDELDIVDLFQNWLDD